MVWSAITSVLGTVGEGVKAVAPVAQLVSQGYGMITGAQDSRAATAQKDAAYKGMAQTQEDARKTMKFEAEKYKDFQAIQEYLLGITKEQLAYAQQNNDPALYQKTMQVYRDVLAGNFPAELFDRLRYEMDEGLRQQMFELNQNFRHVRQELANHVPPGGARTDMLAEMAREYGDKRAALMRQVGEEKRKAMLATYTELYGKATAAGEKQPEDMLKAYTVATQGIKPGPEGNPMGALSSLAALDTGALTTATAESKRVDEALTGITSALTQRADDKPEEKTNIEVLRGLYSNPSTAPRTTSGNVRGIPKENEWWF